MKRCGFYASTVGDQGGISLYRVLVVASLIAALMLASVPVASVVAAPPAQQGDGSSLEESWGNKLNQLQAEVAVFNRFQTKPGLYRNAGNVGQYLDKWRGALTAAQSLVVSGSGFDSNGQVTNQNQARQSVQQLGMYLSMIRGLREKIAEGGRNNTGNNNSSGNNNTDNTGLGIPVTGGDANNNNQNTNQNNTPAKQWGSQFRQLQAAQAWFNNYRTKPGQDRNSEEISRYLDRYASALRAAYSIIANGGITATAGDGQTTVNSNKDDARQQLGMYLSMMRGLREKIAEGGRDNNGNNNSNNTGAGQ